MRTGWVLVLVAVMGGVVTATPPALIWEGRLAWELPGATMRWKSDLALSWELLAWVWKVESSVADGAWTKFSITGEGKLGMIKLAPVVEFDPKAPAFKSAKFSWIFAWLGVKVEGVARLEGKGFG